MCYECYDRAMTNAGPHADYCIMTRVLSLIVPSPGGEMNYQKSSETSSNTQIEGTAWPAVTMSRAEVLIMNVQHHECIRPG